MCKTIDFSFIKCIHNKVKIQCMDSRLRVAPWNPEHTLQGKYLILFQPSTLDNSSSFIIHQFGDNVIKTFKVVEEITRVLTLLFE